MSKKQKKALKRILISAVLLIIVHFLPFTGMLQLLTFLVPYFIIGWDVLRKAGLGILNRQVFDENFLMAIATIGAFFTGEYAEGVAVMLFYQIGELFQSYAVGKSRKSISSLMDIRPDYANVETDGKLEEVDPEDVAVDAVIVVKPGERIPLDGVVLEGTSALDTAALTGESLPRDVKAGDTLISGCINLTGLLRVRVTKAYHDSTVARILDLVENASEKKSKAENFITRFARYYTPVVVIAAVILALVPAVLLAVLPYSMQPAFLLGTRWVDWLHRALIFLVISCPCALVISIPLSFFGGIGGASKCGILVKGAVYLESLAETQTVVFDKTGTLTHGTFTVTAVHPEPDFDNSILEYAALAESYSNHPISISLRQAYAQKLDTLRVSNVQEQSGHGVTAQIDGHTVAVGNDKLMAEIHCTCKPCEIVGTMIHVAIDGQYAGHIVIADTIKEDAFQAISDLKAAGVKRTVMLTGDSRMVAESVANKLQLDGYHAELLPADKVDAVERLLHDGSGNLAFVGDGINDAPVLSRADIGIAMGALGSDAAIEAADIVLMDDKPSKIATAMRISRKTLRIVKQNIIFALGVKLLVLLLGTIGMANMWEAVFADVGVCVIAILNATRALHVQ